MGNMKTRFLFILLVALIIQSCCTAQKESTENFVFSREDFKEIKELRAPEKIIIDSLLNPATFHIVRDSILIVSNQQNCEYLLELYSLTTLKPILQLVTKGNGPEEMLSCSACMKSGSAPEFYLQDWAKKEYYLVHLDSLLKKHKLQPLMKFKYSSEILETTDLCIADDKHYIAYQMWYLDDKKYGNNLLSPLSLYTINEDSEKGINDFTYFVSSVNGARLFRNPKTNQIWTADMHRDIICFYDDSLRQVRKLEGPDKFKPEYVQKQIDAPIAFITFTNDCDYRAYTDYFITDKHIYLVYEGNKHFDPTNLSPVEIFKLDFEGNLLCDYKLDRYVYSISIDSSEKYLYCASRKSVKETPTLLKYKL